MGFKLGSERGNYAVSGEIKTKMRFGKESGGDASVPGVPVIRKPLAEGILGEANMDGSIFISNEVPPNSPMEKQVLLQAAVMELDEPLQQNWRARARMLLFAPEMQKNWRLLPRILEPLVDQLKRGFKMLPIRIASLP